MQITALAFDVPAPSGTALQCFDELSPEHRQVIVAARLIGHSHAEIAAETGRSVEAVGMLLNRALARLARRMHARGRGPAA